MQIHIDNTRRKLGELGAMSQQTEAMERKILARAEQLLSEVEGKVEDARVKAMTGSEADKDIYTDLVGERGRLQIVIANAKRVLSES